MLLYYICCFIVYICYCVCCFIVYVVLLYKLFNRVCCFIVYVVLLCMLFYCVCCFIVYVVLLRISFYCVCCFIIHVVLLCMFYYVLFYFVYRSIVYVYERHIFSPHHYNQHDMVFDMNNEPLSWTDVSAKARLIGFHIFRSISTKFLIVTWLVRCMIPHA